MQNTGEIAKPAALLFLAVKFADGRVHFRANQNHHVRGVNPGHQNNKAGQHSVNLGDGWAVAKEQVKSNGDDQDS